jgi:hypothetical protein
MPRRLGLKGNSVAPGRLLFLYREIQMALIKPCVNDLAVMHYCATDVTMYRVKEVEGRRVGVIDATIEDKRPNQAMQWVDSTMLFPPNNAQRKFFIDAGMNK